MKKEDTLLLPLPDCYSCYQLRKCYKNRDYNNSIDIADKKIFINDIGYTKIKFSGSDINLISRISLISKISLIIFLLLIITLIITTDTFSRERELKGQSENIDKIFKKNVKLGNNFEIIISLDDVRFYFDKNGCNINKEILGKLKELAKNLTRNNIVKIYGFADPDGNDLHNMNLSKSRAELIESYLNYYNSNVDSMRSYPIGEIIYSKFGDNVKDKMECRKVLIVIDNKFNSKIDIFLDKYQGLPTFLAISFFFSAWGVFSKKTIQEAFKIYVIHVRNKSKKILKID